MTLKKILEFTSGDPEKLGFSQNVPLKCIQNFP